MTIFTPRECDIIRLLIKGKTNKEIGNALFISFHTVKRNMEMIFEKTGCKNRVEVTVWIMQHEFEEFFDSTKTPLE